MNKILITGGAGFIGANFARYLVKNKPQYQIAVIDHLGYAGDISSLDDIKEKIKFWDFSSSFRLPSDFLLCLRVDKCLS